MARGSGDDKHTSTLSSLAWISSPLCVVTDSLPLYASLRYPSLVTVQNLDYLGGLGLGMTLSDRMDPLTDRDLQKASCGPVLINQGS